MDEVHPELRQQVQELADTKEEEEGQQADSGEEFLFS